LVDPPFEVADRAPNLPGGGTATTIYDEYDRATEVQVRDGNGNVVSRTLRTYDAQGNVIEEKEILDDPAMLFDSEQRAKMAEESGLSEDQLTQELREGIMKLMGGRSERYSVSCRYNIQGRLSHSSIRAHRSQSEVEITYNEHGDTESEIAQSSRLDKESEQNNAAPLPSCSETRYSYQYDQHDNWIEKAVSHRSSADGAFQSSTVYRRKLAYY
jgi:hypothetical protein